MQVKNKNFDTPQDNVKFLQKGLAVKNYLLKSLMETKTAILEFLSSVWNLDNYTKNKQVSINKSILLPWEAHNSSSKQAVYTSTKQCPKQTEDKMSNS